MTALSALGAGLTVLLPQFILTLAMLAIGVTLHTLVTPYRERELVNQGNAAAGITMTGAMIAMAIPLAATLANHTAYLDILVWGAVAVLLQLSAFGIAFALVGDLRRKIEADNTAAASVVAGVQVAVALVNAGAMAG